MKQWSPRCSQRIKEIYNNDPKKGNSFLEPRLNAFHKEARFKRGKDHSDFLQNLRLRFKPETSEEEAKCQINFKPTKKNAQKIQYLKGKLGLTNSELFEILVLREELSEISPIEPSLVEEGKETPEIPILEKYAPYMKEMEQRFLSEKPPIPKTIDKKAEYHGLKIEDFTPCYADELLHDITLDVFWCAHHMKSSVSDENIMRRARLPKHCKRCNEIHAKQEAERKAKKEERERERQARKDEEEVEREARRKEREEHRSYGKPYVDWDSQTKGYGFTSPSW